MQSRIRLISIFSLCFLFQAIFCSAQIWLPPLYVKAKLEETFLKFYGQVLDQNGDPVPDAMVNYTLSYVGLMKPTYDIRKCRTDSEGKFALHGGKIAQLYIDSVECPGYSYPKGEKVFEFQSIYTNCHKAEKERPVIFHMRKKNKEAVFLHGAFIDLEIHPNENEKWIGYDMFNGWDITPRRIKAHKNIGDLFVDFELSGTYDEELQKWTVTLKTNGENSGFLLSDEMLFEAPESGYVKEKTMEFSTAIAHEAEKNFPKYIYARIREPGFYMRGRFETVFIDSQRFILQCRGGYNPYGGKCLELLQIPDFNLRQKLLDEAHKAMGEQKFMEQPDFAQWIREGKAKY